MEDLKLLTVSDVAPILGAAQSTIYEKVQRGELPCIRLWQSRRKSAIRFTPEMLRQHIERNTQPARANGKR